jgi:hypothetical protein
MDWKTNLMGSAEMVRSALSGRSHNNASIPVNNRQRRVFLSSCARKHALEGVYTWKHIPQVLDEIYEWKYPATRLLSPR